MICGLVKTRPSLSHHALKKEEYQVKRTPKGFISGIGEPLYTKEFYLWVKTLIFQIFEFLSVS